jgi:hypothetical protein
MVDVRMPPEFTDEGLRAAIEIRPRWPGTPVLVLSQHVEERYATELRLEPAETDHRRVLAVLSYLEGRDP